MAFGHSTLGDGVLSPDPDALYATYATQYREPERVAVAHCEPAQVLSDGGQNKLILGGSWTTQTKSAELQDAFQVRKPHLDLLALTSRCLEASVPASDRVTSRACAHVCSAGSCAMVLLDSTAVWAGIHRSRACLHDTEVSYPRARCRSFRAAFLPGSGRRRWSDHIESRCARRCPHPASTCRTQGYVARCPSRSASSASELHRKRYRRQAAPA